MTEERVVSASRLRPSFVGMTAIETKKFIKRIMAVGLGDMSADSIKQQAGIIGAIVSNLTGIPTDRFRVLVAQVFTHAQINRPYNRLVRLKVTTTLFSQDTKSAHGVFSGHLRTAFASPVAAFTGGAARIGMKQMATTLNLYVPQVEASHSVGTAHCINKCTRRLLSQLLSCVPQETRRDYPFLSAFAVGMGFSPILNVPRVLQLGKIAGHSYPETFKTYFGSVNGLKMYASNTAIFGPGEGLRMMMCFGFKDFLMPKIGGNADVNTISSVPMYAALFEPFFSCIEICLQNF